jgi:hypothetical protein
VHLVGFVTNKSVTMHGYMNVKYVFIILVGQTLLFQLGVMMFGKLRDDTGSI